MLQTKTILTTVLLLAVALGPVGTYGAPTNELASPASGLVDAELSRLLDVEDAEAGIDLDPLMGSYVVGPGAPSAFVAAAEDALDRLTASESRLDAFVAAAHAAGVDVTPQVPASQPILPALLEFYAHSGKTPDAMAVLKLQSGIDSTDPHVVDGLALVLTAMNDAAEARATGDMTRMVQATGDLLAAAEASESHFALAASHDACAPLFDDGDYDGFGFVVVAAECDDHHDQHRALSIDLGGDDEYSNNAGGATFTDSEDFFSPFLDTPGVNGIGGRILDTLLPINGSFTGGGLLTNETIDAMLLNETWQGERQNVTDYRARIAQAIEDNNGVFDLPAVLAADLVTCIEFCTVDPGFDENEIKANFPVALALDLGGNDWYHSTEDNVQGAANQGIGVLVDADGHDDYESSGIFSQGAGNFGVGVLIDDGSGDDSYVGGRNSQGSVDAGYLLDLGGDDTYVGGPGSQGARTIPFPTGLGTSVLFDASGSDSYTVTGSGQGVANFLIDAEGDDTYTAHSGQVVDILNGLAQGVGYLASTGLLLDGSGDDVYDADAFGAHGYGLGGNAPGLLVDLGGDDAYTNTGEGQAVCNSVPAAVGALLFDANGNDTYSASRGQGLSTTACGAFLVDADGGDSYTGSGAGQGSSLGQGAALLLDGGNGDDEYTSGNQSQGSGPRAGAGVLIDADGRDRYTAGGQSQGFGSGGVGLLLDGLGSLLSMENSQEAGEDGVSAHGSGQFAPGGPGDVYVAGGNSQGVAIHDGVGLLLDARGGDRYDAEGLDTSRGYGNSSIDGPALGLFVDLDGTDVYFGQPTGPSNDACVEKGEGGLYVDTEAPDLPAGCLDVLVDFAGDVTNAFAVALATFVVETVIATAEQAVQDAEDLVFPPPSSPSPCLSTDYFCDDVESDLAWTIANDVNEWRRENQTSDPQPLGPGAYSGDRYWYVGAPGPSYVTYISDATGTPATITSPSFSLASAVAPNVTLRADGFAEVGYDFLVVSMIDNVSGSTEELGRHSGAADYNDTLEFTVPAAMVGSTDVQLVLAFDPDDILEDGPGYNVDDIRVAEP